MTFGEICTLITTLATTLPAIVTAIIAVVNIIKNKQWDAIKEIADRAMKEVEEYSKTHTDIKGDAKLDMAVEIVADECARLAGVKFDKAMIENVKKYIRSSIDWVNSLTK